MWLLRGNSGHASGRASDLQSQPMSGIEEEEREHELYHTESFAPAGVPVPIAARSPSPPPAAQRYVNIDEELREVVRNEILALQRPVLNMMRQIAGAANIEYHRIVKQEVTEDVVDYVFKLKKQEMMQAKAEERASQWFQDAVKANIKYEPSLDVVSKFKIGVYLRLIKDADKYTLFVGVPHALLTKHEIKRKSSMLQTAAEVYAILVQQNVFGVSMEHDNSQLSMMQSAELSKFNLSELEDIVENYVPDIPRLSRDGGGNKDASLGSESDVTDLTERRVSWRNNQLLRFIKRSDYDYKKSIGKAEAQLLFAGSEPEPGSIKSYVRQFLRTSLTGGEDVTEIDARMNAHIDEASQIVFDVLSSRGGEDTMQGAKTVRDWMLHDDENMGVKLLFARLVANRYCLSQDLAPKQHYLQARFARLRQQSALLLVNLRRLHYKNGKFTLDTSIPRRSYSIY